MTKIKQYLEENAFSLVAIFTSWFTFSEFFDEWMHVTMELKVFMAIIWIMYIYAGTYIDVLRQTIKWNKKQIIHLAGKNEYLERELRRER